MTEETLKIIVGSLATIVVALIGSITKYFINKSSTPKYDEDGITDQFLVFLRHKYGAQRTSVLGYHNGGYWRTGESISKLSVKHESCDVNTSPLIQAMQSISTGMLKELPSMLKHTKFVFEPDIVNDRRAIKPAYYETMRTYGTNATMAFAIMQNKWKWGKFKYEPELVYSIHFNWAEGKWAQSIIKNSAQQVELAKDINTLTTLVCSKCIKNPVLLEQITDTCNEFKKL